MSKPECWRVKESATHGRVYLINNETGESQWGEPVFPSYPHPIGWEKHVSRKGVAYYRNALKNITQWNKPQINKEPDLVEGWIACKSTNCNQTYYKNIATRKTQWNKPDSLEKKNPDRFFESVFGSSLKTGWAKHANF